MISTVAHTSSAIATPRNVGRRLTPGARVPRPAALSSVMIRCLAPGPGSCHFDGAPVSGETESGMTRFLRSRTTLGVKSVPASLEFYEKAVGFAALTTMGEPPTFAIVGPG